MVCGLRVMAYSALCAQCGKWINSKHTSEEGHTKCFKIFLALVVNIGNVLEQEERLCHEMKIVRGITYLGGRVSAGGGCEVAVTA